MNLRIGVVIASSLILATGCAARMPQFGATKDASEPYPQLISYYGHIASGTPPDETRQNKRLHYVYLWLPSDASELGLRLISPTRELPKAEGQTIQEPSYAANADGKEFFDPWMMLERCTTITTPAEVDKTCASWSKLAENDDTAELPEQPSGRKTNSLLRVSGSAPRGLYRIGITDNKRGEIRGTYLLQLGAPSGLFGAALARTTSALKQSAR